MLRVWSYTDSLFQGSAMAMAIHRNLVAVITPRKAHIFRAQLDDLDCATSTRLANFLLSGSVAFAQVAFIKNNSNGDQ